MVESIFGSLISVGNEPKERKHLKNDVTFQGEEGGKKELKEFMTPDNKIFHDHKMVFCKF